MTVRQAFIIEASNETSEAAAIRLVSQQNHGQVRSIFRSSAHKVTGVIFYDYFLDIEGLTIAGIQELVAQNKGPTLPMADFPHEPETKFAVIQAG